MKNYNVKQIRNICLIGHGGTGKTSLTEAMVFNSGKTKRFGHVLDGNTVSDFDSQEIKRQISLNLSLVSCEWKDYKVNILDTPGYFDFMGEAVSAIRVADSALIVVSGKDGIEVGTEKAWKFCEDRKLPKGFFINKVDGENVKYDELVDALKAQFGNSVVPFELAVKEGNEFVGYIDIIKGKEFKFTDKGIEECEIPDAYKPRVDEIMEGLKENVAEASEEFMEKYFAGEEFTHEEFTEGIKKAINEGSLTPVFCGDALHNHGARGLLDNLCFYFPNPKDNPIETCIEKDVEKELKIDENGKFAALVFKTIIDPYVGKLSLFKVMSGKLEKDMQVINVRTRTKEKISHIYTLFGKSQEEVDYLMAGDIGACTKLTDTNTNDTLSDVDKQITIKGIKFPEAVISLGVEGTAKGDEDKIGSGLHRLVEEDPTTEFSINSETHQMLISGIGEQQLLVLVDKLKEKFAVDVNLVDPKIPFRETIKSSAKVEGKHKKQSGGHGQYGHVWIEFSPGEEEGLTFEEKIFGGSVPKNYFPAVEKGLLDSMKQGVLAGYPVVNLKATLVDGSYHAVDSSEMAFKVAASLAFRKGLEAAKPVLLEPIMHLDIMIPDDYMGDIIGDLNKRRGRVMGMTPLSGGNQKVEAEVPMAEIFKYATDLRSMTQGRGEYVQRFARYEEVPSNVSAKIISEYQKSIEE